MLSYLDGDFEAFESLYARHRNRIFGFLMKRLKDRGEAEDVFQSVFDKLHRKRGQYRKDIPFLPWLFTLVRNTLIDHLRKKATQDKYLTFSGKLVEAYSVPASEGLSINAAIAELSSLNENQRQALELRFNQGLTFNEIAEQMQTSTDNSRQIISRAVRKLRKLVVVKGREDE